MTGPGVRIKFATGKVKQDPEFALPNWWIRLSLPPNTSSFYCLKSKLSRGEFATQISPLLNC